jgi:hypothetical protein
MNDEVKKKKIVSAIKKATRLILSAQHKNAKENIPNYIIIKNRWRCPYLWYFKD